MNEFMARHAGALQLGFVVAVVGLALLLSVSLRPEASGPGTATRSNVPAVTVVTPAATPFTPVIELNGVVQARTVTRIIPQVSGRIVQVASKFRPGASVSKGDLLFIIDPSDYRLAVERTLAEIAVARSDLARLEAEAAAEREIWQGQFPDRPIPDLIARVPQIAAARARIQSGEAAQKSAELALSRTTVRAPFDARILETQLDVGQVVSGSAAVGSMFSIDSLEIAVPVSAEQRKLIGTVSGQDVSIIGSVSREGVIDGKLARASAALDERTRLGTLYVTADQPELLTAGEFATVRIAGENMPDSYRVPAAALTSRDRLWVVEDGQLAGRTVEVLGREADMAVVRVFDDASGIVAIPPANARDGLAVSIRGADGLASTGNDAQRVN
ncbi:MAG: efflux RND transporter periplasmic adaptor subunit [Gammaproteobacteria bacterium]|nr:efflux RND transporter periplasmic adaptor subunit [Gammaproteobacteria bacterium]